MFVPASSSVLKFCQVVLSALCLLLLFELSAQRADALCIINNTSTEFQVTLTLDGESESDTIAAYYSECGESGTDPLTPIQINASTDDFLCIIEVLAGGIFEFNEQIRAPSFGPNTPSNFYCVSRFDENQTGVGYVPTDVNGDGEISVYTYSYTDVWAKGDASPDPMIASNRLLRYLVTADPQFITNHNNAADEATWNESAQEVLATMVNDLKEGLGDIPARGIVIAGDLTQTARDSEVELYTDATAGIRRLFFDGLGNHDPGEINKLDLETIKRQTRLSLRQGIHYSWEWHDIHFQQLNVFGGDEPISNRLTLDPMDALLFMFDDHLINVGDKKRPTVVIQHYGYDTFSCGFGFDSNGNPLEPWWSPEQRLAFLDLAESQNVIAVFSGHYHLGSNSSQSSWVLELGRCQNSGEACYVRGNPADYCGSSSDTCVSNGIINYIAGAARGSGENPAKGDGTYLDVEMNNCNQMIVRRMDRVGVQQDIYVQNYIDAAAREAEGCFPNAVCRDITKPADSSCEVSLTEAEDMYLGSEGNCYMAQGGGYPTAPYDLGVHTPTVFCEGTAVEADSSGNLDPVEDFCYAELTVVDKTAPVFSEDQSCAQIAGPKQCGEQIDYVLATATDNCEGDVVADCTPTPQSRAWGVDDTEVSCTVVDSENNSRVCNAQINVVDTIKPVITVPGDVQTECTSPLGTIFDFGQATAADSCDPDPTIINNAPRGFPLGQTTVTWTAGDSFANTISDTQVVTVVDTSKPTIFGPADIIAAECTNFLGTPVPIGSPNVSDACTTRDNLTVSNDAGVRFPLGTTEVAWTVTDPSGNSNGSRQKVTVVDTSDPTITAPDDVLNVQCTDYLGTSVSLGSPIVYDSCYLAASLSVTNNAPASFPLGGTTVIWEVKDGSNNAAIDPQEVSVIDTEKPSITPPADVAAFECTSPTGTAVPIGSAVVGDICYPTAELSVQNNAPALFSLGTTVVKWEVSDPSSNAMEAFQNVEIVDSTKPVISCPESITVEPESALGTAVVFAATAADVCDSTPTTTCDVASGTTFEVGSTTTINCTAADASTNDSSCSFSVTVLSEEEVIVVLGQTVEEIAAAASLNNGETTSLLAKLDSILAQIEAGSISSACSQLAAFEQLLNNLINNGSLTAEEAATLFATTSNLKQTLGC